MHRHAFIVAGDRVIQIANASGAGLQYQAQLQVVLPDTQLPPQRHDTAETLIFVREGVLEMMIGGAAGHVRAGSFVRVPAMTWFAWRNSDESPAKLLVRTTPPEKAHDSLHVTIRIAAA